VEEDALHLDEAALLELRLVEAGRVEAALGRSEEGGDELVRPLVAPERAPRLHRRLALGAVAPPHPDPFLNAVLAETVHARRRHCAVEVPEADGAAQQVEDVGRLAAHPKLSHLVPLRRLLLLERLEPRVRRSAHLDEGLQPARRRQRLLEARLRLAR